VRAGAKSALQSKEGALQPSLRDARDLEAARRASLEPPELDEEVVDVVVVVVENLVVMRARRWRTRAFGAESGAVRAAPERRASAARAARAAPPRLFCAGRTKRRQAIVRGQGISARARLHSTRRHIAAAWMA
jgi:hypothetical protein